MLEVVEALAEFSLGARVVTNPPPTCSHNEVTFSLYCIKETSSYPGV